MSKTILLDNDDRILLSSITGVRLSTGRAPGNDHGILTVSHTLIIDRGAECVVCVVYGFDLASAELERDRIATAWAASLGDV